MRKCYLAGLFLLIPAVFLLCTQEQDASAYHVKEKIVLFNGKDLTNFYTYLKGIGKNKDPKKVFTV